MKIPFWRPDDDDPVARAERMVFEREPGSIERTPSEDGPTASPEPAASTPAATVAPTPGATPRGTKVLVGAAVIAMLVGAALVAIPILTGDDDDPAGALPETWPPDDPTRAWAEPTANPEPAACGDTVGLLIDRSVPVDPGRSVPNLSVTTDAAGSYIDAIGLTPTPVGFWSFGTYGDPSGADDVGEPTGVVDFPARTPVVVAGVAGPERRSDLDAGLESIPFGFTSSDSDQVELSERNWEAGLRAVNESEATPRTVILITTGSPTTHDDDAAREKGVDPLDLDPAILAANELKAGGTRIVAIGLEDADPVALAAISGPVMGDAESLELGDHYLTDRDGLEATLEHVAAAQCGGTVTVAKSVRELAGDDPTAGEGWQYRLSVDGDVVEEQATDGSGLALLRWPEVDGVLLQEAGEDGYQLPLDGSAPGESGARCRRAGPEPEVAGLDVPGGFELEVDASQVIGCAFSSVRSYVDLVVDLVPLSTSTPPGSTVRYDVTYRNAGTLPATGTVVQFVVPDGATVAASDNEHPWRCEGGFPAPAGATCTFTHPDPDLEPASPFYALWLDARVDQDTDRSEIEAAALIVSENLADPVPEDNLVSVVTSTSDAPPPTTTTAPPTTTPPTTAAPPPPPPTTTTTTVPTTTTTTTTTVPPPPPPPPTVAPTTSTTSSSSTTTTVPPSTTTTVPPPVPLSEDLVVEVTSDARDAGVGEFVDVTIVARNQGDQVLDGAMLSLAPPAGTSLEIRSSDVGWRCEVTCTIDVGAIEPGASSEVEATLAVRAPDGRRSIDIASTLQGETSGGAVAATGSTTVSLATVDIGVSLQPVDEPVAGEVARFQVMIENRGSVEAAEVELDLNLPEPLQLDTLSGSDAASCRPVSGRCSFLMIGPGATEVLTASWSVPRSLPSEEVEVAALVTTPLADETPDDNAASLESTVDGIRVEAFTAPSGLFENSDTSTWLGVGAAIVSAVLIVWIFTSGIRHGRREPEPDLGERPERDGS